MNKSKEVWLSPEEVKYMLQGSLLWTDVSARLAMPRKTGIRRLGDPLARKAPGENQQEDRADNKPDGKSDNESDNKPNEKQGETSGKLVTKEVLSKVAWLLGVVGTLTFLSWVYFAFLV